MTVAQLGIEVTSAPAKRAVADLDSLTASAGRTEAAVESMGRSASTAIKATGGGLSDFSKRVQTAANDTESMSARIVASQRANTQALKNFGFQVNDTITGLLTGQRPLQVFLQQGGQFQQAFGQHSGGAAGVMKDFATSLRGLASPTTLAVGSIGALAAVSIAAVASWKNYALALDDISKRTGVASGEMSKLQAAASFKGIGQGEFSDAMGKFSAQVYLAQRNMGDLAEMFQANGVQARTFSQYLEGVAELVKRAADEERRYRVLGAAGLPQTAQFMRFIQTLKEGKAAAADFANDEALIKKAREFDDAWNKVWTNFGLYARGAAQDTLTHFKELETGFKTIPILGTLLAIYSSGKTLFAGAAPTLSTNLNNSPLLAGARMHGSGTDIAGGMYPNAPKAGFTMPGGPRGGIASNIIVPQGLVGSGASGGAGTTIDPAAVRREIELEQQRIGALGQLAGVTEQVRQAENQLRLLRMEPGSKITDADVKRILDYARAQAESERVSAQASFGIYDAAKAQAALNGELQTAISRGLLDPNNAGQMASANVVLAKSYEQLRDRAALAAAPLEGLKRLQLEGANTRTLFDSAATNIASNLNTSLVDIATNAKSGREALTDLGKAVQREVYGAIIKQTITGPLAGLTNDMFGGSFKIGGAAASTPLMNVTAATVNIGGVSMAGLGGLPGVTPPGAAGFNASAGVNPMAFGLPTSGGTDIMRSAAAIRAIESSGNYSAMGPVTRTGDRAYGAYQVMGSNVGPWSQQYYGQRLSPQEFVNNPTAQDSVFQGQFGGYMGKYGGSGAAAAWFAGEKGMSNPNAMDGLGTSTTAYVAKYNAALKSVGDTAQASTGSITSFGTNVQAAGTQAQAAGQQAQSAASGFQITSQGLGQLGAGLGSMLGIIGGSLAKSPTAKAIFMGATPLFSLLGKGLFSSFGFADGGIMTGGGPISLKRYAAGGVANSPQMAMFGEGSVPEAYVPLPDGRSIPVRMQGGGGGVNIRGGDIHIHGNVDSEQRVRDIQRAVQSQGSQIAQQNRALANVAHSQSTGVQRSQ